MSQDDVPSPIDLRRLEDARQWEQSAMATRPWRAALFALFCDQIVAHSLPITRVLELGSGPGFLAAHLLGRLPEISYVALDFSPAMHSLARTRLGEALCTRVRFVERSFKEDGWWTGLGTLQCVVTNQAVHELRHKRHAPRLHAQVLSLIEPGGCYLMCDHFAGEGGMTDNNLYMTKREHEDALTSAGFGPPQVIGTVDTLIMYRATVASDERAGA